MLPLACTPASRPLPSVSAEPVRFPAASARDDSAAGTRQEQGSWLMPRREACATRYSSPAVKGSLEEVALTEASGIVASPGNPGVLWIHNDSGNVPAIYALAEDGRALGRLTLGGIRPRDLEDIAAAPCPDGSRPCIWLADTGDNHRHRDDVAIYAVTEPTVVADRPFGSMEPDRIWRFPIVYPDGPVDSEALIVAPDLSALYLFEKTVGATARLFKLAGPFREGQVGALEHVATLRSPGIPVQRGRMITAADLHPSGERVLVRVYSGSVEYALSGRYDLDDLGSSSPVFVALGPLTEPQGEAIAYDAVGTGIWTVSESPSRIPGQPLHHYACRRSRR